MSRNRTLPRTTTAFIAAMFGLAASLPWAGAWAQTYSTATTGPVTGNGGALTVTNTGSITNPSGFGAVQANSGAGAITTLTNDGTLSSQGATVQTSTTGSIGTLQNNATISATNANGFAVYVPGTISTLNNAAGATISGGSSTQFGAGLYVTNSGTVGALTNSGTLTGSNAIQNYGTISSLTNQSGGTISGTNGTAIQSYNVFGSFTNAAGATISGSVYSLNLGNNNGGPAPSMGAFSNAGTMTGAISIAGGDRSISVGSFTNSGSITETLGNTGVFLHGGYTMNGTLGSFSNTGSITSAGYGLMIQAYASAGTLSNSGTISSANGIGVVVDAVNGANFTNSGTIQESIGYGFQSGSGFGTLTNTAGGTISGTRGVVFQYQSTGTPGLVNNGTITGTEIAVVDSFSGTHLQQIVNTGTINGSIGLNGPTTIVGGSGSVFGVLNGTVGNGMSLVGSSGSATFTGNTRLNESIVTNAGFNNQGTVTNNGTLQLANAQTIYGYLNQAAGSTLDLMFAGNSAGQYGNLTSTQSAVLAGTLALETTGAFSFSFGHTYDIMDFSSRTGDFSAFSLNGTACTSQGTDVWNCGGGLLFTEVFSANGHQLNLVTSAPEPASMAVLVAGLAGLAGIRRARTRGTSV